MNTENFKFKEGDIVKIKSEWANSDEEKENLYVITENSIWEKEQKCLIKPITGNASKLPIVPSERVSFNMIYLTGINLKSYKESSD